MIEWIHADPLTGSSERVVKAGTSWYRTEYEPLGMQEVFPFEPEDEFPDFLKIFYANESQN